VASKVSRERSMFASAGKQVPGYEISLRPSRHIVWPRSRTYRCRPQRRIEWRTDVISISNVTRLDSRQTAGQRRRSVRIETRLDFRTVPARQQGMPPVRTTTRLANRTTKTHSNPSIKIACTLTRFCAFNMRTKPIPRVYRENAYAGNPEPQTVHRRIASRLS